METANKAVVDLRNLGYIKAALEITNMCNFACVWCPYSLGKTRPRQMTREETFRALGELARCGGDMLESIELNVLGEPLLHRDLLDIIEYAHRYGMKVKLVTNGSLFSEKNIDAVLKGRPDILKVSFELFNRKGFNSIRGTEMPFDKYMEKVVNLVKRRLEYGKAIPTLLQIDLLYISRFYPKRLLGLIPRDAASRHAYRRKTELFRDTKEFLERVREEYPEFNYDEKELSENFKKIEYENFSNEIPLYRISEEAVITLKEYLPWINIKDKLPAEGPVPCSANEIGILADGRVILCCLDHKGETAIGNIFDDTLENILTDRKDTIEALRRGEHTFEICRRCQGYFSKRHKLVKRVKRK